MSFGSDIGNGCAADLAFRFSVAVVGAVAVVLVLMACWRWSPYSLKARVDALEQRVEAIEKEGGR